MSKGSSQRLYAATRTGVWRSNDAGASWSRVLRRHGRQRRMHGSRHPAPTGRSPTCSLPAARLRRARVRRAIDTAGTQHVDPDAGLASRSWAAHRSRLPRRTRTSSTRWQRAPRRALSIDGLLGVCRSSRLGVAPGRRYGCSNTSPVKLNTLLLSNPVFARSRRMRLRPRSALPQPGLVRQHHRGRSRRTPTSVWAGGIDLFRSDDGGAELGAGVATGGSRDGVDPEYAHADNHALVFHPHYDGSSNKTMFIGNDGGVYRTDDARAPCVSRQPHHTASPAAAAPGRLESRAGRA